MNGARAKAARREDAVDKDYRLFVAIVMGFWVIAIAVALIAAIIPTWSHFGM